MHIDITPEALLTQFDYPINEHTLDQMTRAIDNTPGFHKFSKHLISLKDAIHHYDGFIALSSSYNYIKIKCEESDSEDSIESFTKATKHWGEKYKVTLEKVPHKPTYYILGYN
ncbi:MAG: hypothetical protein U9R27_11580 [Campylobacterota bacterium]|nr:hypothetical protein [Campylobacterota bacterium]